MAVSALGKHAGAKCRYGAVNICPRKTEDVFGSVWTASSGFDGAVFVFRKICDFDLRTTTIRSIIKRIMGDFTPVGTVWMRRNPACFKTLKKMIHL